MHIGFIEDTPLKGGTQIWVTEAARALLAKGEEVTVLAPTGSYVATECRKIRARVVTYEYDDVVSESDEFKKTWIEALGPCEVAVTTVHPPRNGFHCTIFGARCIKEGKLKTILIPKTGSIVPWYKREYYMPDPEVNTRIICITDFARKYLIDVYKLPPDKIELIYQGTEVNRFTSSPESKHEALARYPLPAKARPVLGSVGSLENRKGQIILLQAVKRLLDNNKLPDIHLIFVGEGPDEEMLKAVTRVYDLKDHVTFFPFTSEPNFVFERIDILVLPSLYKEGLPNVLLEAMSMKLPVISTDITGIPEVVFDGETGYLTDPGNIEQFSDAIEKVWSSRETCERMGNNARKLMEEKMDKRIQFEAFRKYFYHVVS
ncbi:MAG: glycosyltransferase family 4 protein [Bacteroidia bacterium]|nr:glycosyltransferase family 4 protein [Bacteroidia bacterium]